jgi:hypothetical protein
VEGPGDYWLANASLYWRIREWLSWNNSVMLSTGQGDNQQSQTTITSSLNVNF